MINLSNQPGIKYIYIYAFGNSAEDGVVVDVNLYSFKNSLVPAWNVDYSMCQAYQEQVFEILVSQRPLECRVDQCCCCRCWCCRCCCCCEPLSYLSSHGMFYEQQWLCGHASFSVCPAKSVGCQCWAAEWHRTQQLLSIRECSSVLLSGRPAARHLPTNLCECTARYLAAILNPLLFSNDFLTPPR